MAEDYLGLKAEEPIARIAEAYTKIGDAERGTIKYAREIGKLLRAAKKTVTHGFWAEWIADNCPFSKRTASDCMRISAKWADIEDAADAKGQHAADLSIREALDLLAPPPKDPLSDDAKLDAKMKRLTGLLKDAVPSDVLEGIKKAKWTSEDIDELGQALVELSAEMQSEPEPAPKGKPASFERRL